MITRIMAFVATLLTCAVLGVQTGCINSTQLADGGISGTGITNGPISGFGSVIANGIHFDSDSAAVTFNGLPGSIDMLESGMLVTMAGQYDAASSSGTAASVAFEYTLTGQVESRTDVIEVLGQVVSVDARTVYRNTDLATLAVGDYIAVSGLASANGSIRATYLEQVAAPAELVVVGQVTGLDVAASTFRILNLNRQVSGGIASTLPQQLVDFSQAQLAGFAGAVPADGDLVRITGTLAGSRLNASLVSNQRAALAGNPGDHFLLQGLLQAHTPGSALAVNGQAVRLDAATLYINTTASGLAPDDSLQIEGAVAADGSLLATRVIRLDQPTVTLHADIDSLDPTAGTLELLGLSVTTNLFTVFDDSSSAALKPFSLGALAAGDRLIVSGYVAAGDIVASSVVRVDSAPGAAERITGQVDTLPGAPLFEIAGLPIDTGSLQDFSGFLEGSLAISGAGFFQALRSGMAVEVLGQYSGAGLQPSSVRIVACCNLSILDPNGIFVGGLSDVVATWDGTLYSDPSTQTAANMTLASATAMPFFGQPWLMHDVRAFGPGNYSFTTTRGSTLTLAVAPGQVGAHMLVDWGTSLNVDAVLLWEVDGVYAGSRGSGSDLGSRGFLFNLAGIDGDGDGIPGIRFADGPFRDFQPVINVNLTTP